MTKLPITTHSLIKNEDRWIWFSLMSVKDHVSQMLVFDDNSTDNTLEIINKISDPKIDLTRGILKTASGPRNEMLAKTRTEWFLILDGDEVWNQKTLKNLLVLLSQCPKNIYGVVMRTRNCVGDVFHYQPEDAGRYNLLGHRGNLNIRAFRKLPGFHWRFDYPRETYCDAKGQPIDKQDSHLIFFDDYYWHMTFLPRSSLSAQRKYPQISKSELGIKISSISQLPEVFFQPHPAMVPDPLKSRNLGYLLKAAVETPLKFVKRRIPRP